MGAPIIFKSIYAKLLAAAGLEFKDGTQITTSSTVNPSVTATTGTVGNLWINTLLGRLFIKKDSGSTTNWADVQNLTTFATVAAAKAGTPKYGDGNVCYIEEKQAFYGYCTMCVRAADDDLMFLEP